MYALYSEGTVGTPGPGVPAGTVYLQALPSAQHGTSLVKLLAVCCERVYGAAARVQSPASPSATINEHTPPMGGLPKDVYQQIIQAVDVPVMCCLNVRLVALKHNGVRPETIASIFAQQNQHKVIKTHHRHVENMPNYCSRYVAGEDILDLCAGVDFPPCLMIRRMMEVLLRLNKQRVGDILKDPAQLHGMTDKHAYLQEYLSTHKQQSQKHLQSQQLRQHSQCLCGESTDVYNVLQRLQADVVRCVHADRSYSPFCDMAKSLAGLEHEALLYEKLQQADVPYWSEEQLRERGLFKTPDALLQVPICVCSPDGGSPHLVHWIDSKACFGDDRTHSQQLEGQYRTYTNRYGPGLVIYWFGYVQGLENDPDVMMLDSFPADQDILQLPRLSAG